MKYLNKILFFIGGFLLLAGIVSAAPASNILRNILPEATDTYQIGTTTPAARWLTVFSRDASLMNATTTNLYSTSIGASTNRIPKGWFTDLDSSLATIG